MAMSFRALYTILFISFSIVISPRAALADGLADIRKAGILRIAIPEDFPPFGSVGMDLSPRGYDVEMANLVAKSIGVRVELIAVKSIDRIPYLQGKKVDLVISSLGKNAEREKLIDFSEAYAPFFSGVFGPPNLTAHSPQDLAGKTIALTRGSVEDVELSKIAPPTAILKRYDDNNGALTAFFSGEAQFIATGNVVAATFVAWHTPKRPEVKFLIKNSPCYVGVNKSEPALLAKVNEAIQKAKKDGSLSSIAKRWLGSELPEELRS